MSDKHIALAVMFDVPAGEDYKSHIPKFYEITKSGTDGCLYYGFATCGNKLLCREGYKDAVSMLTHSKEVAGDLEALIKKIGKERVQIICSGPQDQLDIIKSKMDERLTVKFVTLDAGALSIAAMPKGCADSHVTILPEFVMPAGREAEFQAGFPKFYNATKGGKGASGCIYYGFGMNGSSVYCREGYVNAEAALLHGADVKEMIEEPMKAVGAGGFKLNVVGPKAELDKLRPKLEARGAIFWELDAGAFWK